MHLRDTRENGFQHEKVKTVLDMLQTVLHCNIPSQLRKQFTVLFDVASYTGPFALIAWEEKMAWYQPFFDDVMLWYNFLQNVHDALYVPRLLHGGTLKALHSLVHPGGVEGRPSWKL